MTITAGIDLGSHVLHIGIIRNETNEVLSAAHLTVDKSHDPADVADLYDRLVQYFQINWVDRVVIERPLIFPGKGYPILHMSEMYSLAKLAAHRVGATFIEVTPAGWRKRVFGRGNANKSFALEYCKELGYETKDHNQAESICIGMY